MPSRITRVNTPFPSTFWDLISRWSPKKMLKSPLRMVSTLMDCFWKELVGTGKSKCFLFGCKDSLTPVNARNDHFWISLWLVLKISNGSFTHTHYKELKLKMSKIEYKCLKKRYIGWRINNYTRYISWVYWIFFLKAFFF